MSATQHIEWLNLVEKTGPFLAVGVLDEAFPQGLDKVETRQRQRVRSAYDEWRDAVDSADPQLAAIHREWVRLVLRELLDYDSSILKPQSALPDSLAYQEPFTGVKIRPDFAALSGETPKLFVACHAPDTALDAPLAGDTWVASPIERMIQLCRALGVRLGLVTDGECWTVVSVPPDGASSVATWFARIWQQEPVTLQAFVSLLGVRRCFGRAEDTFDSLLQRSQGHQNEITDTLGEQVRRAVEVLVQALDQADVAHNRQLLAGVTPSQLYEAGLTVMMRLVILLCAEQRKLLLLGEETYDQHYAVTTLRARLAKEQTDLTDEVLERRHDAWSRLLALCRGVYGGIEHDTLRLPPLGGSLFDPDRFPFLEGRAAGTSWRDTPANPLPIDNRTVLMLLTALQILEQSAGAQMLSYEALDVEQIGHVYEGLLERTVKRVPEVTLGLIGSAKSINPIATLSELEQQAAAGAERFVEFLEERTGRSMAGLRNSLDRLVDDMLIHRVAVACGSEQTLVPRLRPFALLLREDNWKRLLVYQKDSFIVTMGAGRRETGTHYTPKSLTEPIVQHTLEPLVYDGPAEGRQREEWRLKSSSEILGLKVCDMAMGSGAFLVQTCRWLGERLVEAWNAEETEGRVLSIEGAVLDELGTAESMPRDKSERVLVARRLIASRCVFGVDINPMAVELAKLSMWLVTMMRNRPFNYLDHALKCGDSLLGISDLIQLESFSVRDPEHDHPLLETSDLWRHTERAASIRCNLEEMPSHSAEQIAEKTQLHAEAEAILARLIAAADFLLAAELDCPKGRGWITRRAIAANRVKSAWTYGISEFKRLARTELKGRRPFHWPLEFPEVFANTRKSNKVSGFDAFVGNPPFIKGSFISRYLGEDLRQLLSLELIGCPTGLADYSTFFVIRGLSLATREGNVGLLVTNGVQDGDSSRVGVQMPRDRGATLRYVRTEIPWPGGANVIVCFLVFTKGSWQGLPTLNGMTVEHISNRLTAEESLVVHPLKANSGMSFLGNKILGDGFLLGAGESIAHEEEQTAGVVLPYMNGQELNNFPVPNAQRRAICFWDWDLARAESLCPKLIQHVRLTVKPVRDRVGRDRRRELWWIYAENTPGLYHAVGLGARFLNHPKGWRSDGKRCIRVLAKSKSSDTWAFEFLAPEMIFDQSLAVIVLDTFSAFAVLQSAIHWVWADKLVSGNKGREARQQGGAPISYTPSRVFETFPLPQSGDMLEAVGLRFHEFRRGLMAARGEGLTKTYGRFHSPDERDDGIEGLREMHRKLDAAVAGAYGWADLAANEGAALRHDFYEIKQGIRWTLHSDARCEVLNRLLALNHQRHAEEVSDGLLEKELGGKRREKPSVDYSELELL